MVTEHRILRDERADPVHRNGEHFAGLKRYRCVELGLAGEQAQFAQEPAGAVHADHPLLVHAVPVDHGHSTGQDDVERLNGLALDEQHLAGLDGSPFAVDLQRVQLGLIEPGVGAIQVRCFGQRSRLGQIECRHQTKLSST